MPARDFQTTVIRNRFLTNWVAVSQKQPTKVSTERHQSKLSVVVAAGISVLVLALVTIVALSISIFSQSHGNDQASRIRVPRTETTTSNCSAESVSLFVKRFSAGEPEQQTGSQFSVVQDFAFGGVHSLNILCMSGSQKIEYSAQVDDLKNTRRIKLISRRPSGLPGD